MIRFGLVNASTKTLLASILMAIIGLMPMIFVMALVWQLLLK